MNVAVVGAAGYAGGELLRLLYQHPEVREVVATSRSRGGALVSEAHPALATLTDARFSAAEPGEIARDRDVVFLCLEHGESSRVAGDVFASRPGLVVDLADEFRVRSRALYERHGFRATAEIEFLRNESERRLAQIEAMEFMQGLQQKVDMVKSVQVTKNRPSENAAPSGSYCRSWVVVLTRNSPPIRAPISLNFCALIDAADVSPLVWL